MFSEYIPAETILFFILYGITGVVPLLAALYLLLRRGNAFAPDITPPMRLRRWAAAFFAVAALGHVWWYLFYFYSHDIRSIAYFVVVTFDYVGMVTTIAGTMLSMLQDRRRPIWPAFVAMIPFMVLGALQIFNPDTSFLDIAFGYNLVLYVLFFVYMVFAVRRYGQWLDDNYVDLENKKVWLTQTVSLAFVLFFILYVLVDTNFNLLFLLHIAELVFFGLLLWRVETLPSLTPYRLTTDSLTPDSSPEESEVYSSSAGDSADNSSSACDSANETKHFPLSGRAVGTEAVNIDLAQIEQLLAEHCVDTQLYLQHDLTLQQLAQAIGTNRFYLSQYFSRQGITYNTYINNLRINHFINRYQVLAAARQPVVAQQLASESGYRSYSTFSLAFKQRTGQSVTAWMRDTGG